MLAVVPARGGSKGVPGKNVALVAGQPLVARAVAAARAASRVTEVAVSTDDPLIAQAARAAGAQVVDRPAELATDASASEDALRHAILERAAARGETPEVTVMIQATSPFVTSAEIDGVVEAVAGGADCAFTAVPFHGFVWREDGPGVVGVDHDHLAGRRRRQELAPRHLETGAAYAVRTEQFLAVGNRFFGTVAAVATPPERLLEVDDADQLAWARRLAPLLDGPDGAPWPTRTDVDAVVFDFDGVLTPNTALVAADGAECVVVNRSDGLALGALRRAGLALAILSGEENDVVRARAAKLRLECLAGVADKAAALTAWCRGRGIAPERVMFVGNDVNDLPAFRVAGWPVAVASAWPEAAQGARLRTRAAGGEGVAREIADRLLGESWWARWRAAPDDGGAQDPQDL
ncbi:MAG: acylneuraminate cytidylyltransferase [Bifidobacteriaceae bacterium]|nr:acylneuraminate cytidylyltransferase [Bifidobacteriaceae bacterium]